MPIELSLRNYCILIYVVWSRLHMRSVLYFVRFAIGEVYSDYCQRCVGVMADLEAVLAVVSHLMVRKCSETNKHGPRINAAPQRCAFIRRNTVYYRAGGSKYDVVGLNTV